MTNFLEEWRRLPALQRDAHGSEVVGKPERTRRRLLGFAMKLFEEKGYQPTTATDIAKAAGVSRATFFVHFPTKAALLGEVSRELAEQWSHQPQVVGERATQRISRFIAFLFRESQAGAVGTALLRDFVETYGDDMSAGSGEGTLHHYAEEMIRQAQEDGDWTSEWSSSTLAHHLLSTFARLQGELRRKDSSLASEMMMQIVLYGVATRRHPPRDESMLSK